MDRRMRCISTTAGARRDGLSRAARRALPPALPPRAWAMSSASSQFGVNLLELPPGAWSSQRHWHERQDEFIYVLEGEVDAGDR